ncbi:undecaprenyl/decaprenyl-phosphate alpha-N-acetylglucosaminyl 1-phosphate transferase [Flavobacteriaceae bacterium]|nr:undecaprenyl/decaprenyl-phosphate alpha-N-acetylglucosaminyl 1-phosphate transferase [Flavobacteriaceae bacterium]
MNISMLLSALVLSSLLHFGIQKVLIYFKKFDDFNYRSSHKTLATRTGGIGVFTTLLAISLFYYSQGIELFDYSLFIPLSIMFIVGVYDDFYNADFKLKFLLQIIVAKILIDQGFVISNYHGLFGLHEIPRVLAQLTTVFVFLVVVNSINLIDGIDGLAITEVIKSIVIIEYFSFQFTSLAPLFIILIAGLIPLYYFNFKKKKKIFLGDGGSLLLGTIVAVYLFHVLSEDFMFAHEAKKNKVVFAIIVLFYPLFDLLRVFIIRIKNNKSPFYPDQNHLHHKLVDFFNGNHLATLLSIQIISLILFLVLFAIT